MTSLRQIQNEELLTRAARASVDAASPSPPTTILGFAIAASPPAAAAAASPGPSPPPAAAAPSPSSSIKACKYFARAGGCKNGDACRFATSLQLRKEWGAFNPLLRGTRASGYVRAIALGQARDRRYAHHLPAVPSTGT